MMMEQDKIETIVRHYIKPIILIFYSLITLPIFIGGISNGLDSSWNYCLNRMNSFGDILFGRDVTSTYGPLGFLYLATDVNYNMLYSFLFYLVLFVSQLFMFRKLISKKDIPNLIIFLAVFVLFLGRPSRTADTYIEFCALLGIAVLWTDINDLFVMIYVISLFIVAFFFKFSTLIGLTATYIMFWIGKLMLRQNKRIWLFFLPFLCMLGCYLLYSFSLESFLGYIKGGIEISSGYNTGMSCSQYDPYAFWIFFMMSIYIVIMILMLITKNKHNFWAMMWFSPCLFLAYKHGFVRADSVHIIESYAELLAVFGLLILSLDYENIWINFFKRKNVNYVMCVLMISLYAMAVMNTEVDLHPWISLKNNIHDIPVKIYNLSEKKRERIKDTLYTLSEDTIQMIDGNKFTSFPWEICYLERNTELIDDFLPLPTLQLYSAYTEYLDNWTANMFNGNNKNGAPVYILMTFETIDGRLPLIEAPATWRAIKENYSFVGKDSMTGWYILKRIDHEIRKNSNIKKTFRHTVNKTNEIKTNDCSEIKINLNLNLKGKLEKIIWKIPEVRALIKYTDGTVKEGRILPETIINGIQTKGLAYDENTLVDSLLGNGIKAKIQTIQLQGDGLSCYEDEIEVEYIYYDENNNIELKLSNIQKGDNGELEYFIEKFQTTPYLRVKGWAIIKDNKEAYTTYLKVGNNYYLCDKESRFDVIDHFGIQDTSDNVGYSIQLETNTDEKISLLLVTENKYYEVEVTDINSN